MSVKLDDTQLLLLSAASQREDLYLTLPSGARLAPARKAANKLLAAGLVREVPALKDAPIWRREEETERAFAFKIAWARRSRSRARRSRDDADEWRTPGGR